MIVLSLSLALMVGVSSRSVSMANPQIQCVLLCAVFTGELGDAWASAEHDASPARHCTLLNNYCGVMSQSYCKGYLRCIWFFCLFRRAAETGCSTEYSHQDTCLRETAHISAHLYTPTEISHNKIMRLHRHKIICMRKCTYGLPWHAHLWQTTS